MPTASINHATGFDVRTIRAQFPALGQRVYDKPLVYLDNAATSQKPAEVIEALQRYYRDYNANVHRGLHRLSELATEAYEDARRKVAGFIHTEDPRQIIFTRGTTESINLVAHSYGGQMLKSGDEVLITHMEHHSNIVPWQLICERTGAKLKVAPIADDGSLIMTELEKLLSKRTKIVAVTHISNALGTINPVKRITQAAHGVGAAVLIDGAQAAPHEPVDVTEIGCDFYAFSGHKMFGPTGIGVLFGRHELLERMPPYQGGGEMIESVKFEKTLYREPPARFEAGTPHIAGAIGLGAAIDWMNTLDWPAVMAHEAEVLEYGTAKLREIEGLKLIGTAPRKAAVLGFTLEGIAPYDISPVLDHQGVAVRVGHHCAQPVMERFGISATVRASIALYNSREDIDALCAAMQKVKQIFA